MTGEEVQMGEAGAGGGAGPARRVLRMSRGFSCLFWGVPVMAGAQVAALAGVAPTRWMLGVLPACYLPLMCGLWMLRACGEPTRRWRGRVRWVMGVAFVAMYLCPFLAWWSAAPLGMYFAGNVAAHAVAVVGLLAGLNGMAREAARWMGDVALRREASAGVGMVLWLSGCTVLALGWMFQRAGVLDAGTEAVLGQLSQLPGEARMLFLLPHAMTAYVMWRAKETGFRKAVGAAP